MIANMTDLTRDHLAQNLTIKGTCTVFNIVHSTLYRIISYEKSRTVKCKTNQTKTIKTNLCTRKTREQNMFRRNTCTRQPINNI